MKTQPEHLAKGYDSTYAEFDSPLQQQIRAEAYGVDIGQHSWVTIQEVQKAVELLGLSAADTLLDFGCGPCGPLTFLVQQSGCAGCGVDISAPALRVGQQRAERMGIASRVQLSEVDGNQGLPFAEHSFSKAISFDVVLHLRNRATAFGKIAKTLKPGGLFLFTDAGVVTGAVSNQEIQHRSINGFTQFVPPGYNERLLAQCGFKIIQQQDHTDGVIANAAGRIKARSNHQRELIAVEGEEKYSQQQRYLETVVDLSERRALSRMSYLVEVGKS